MFTTFFFMVMILIRVFVGFCFKVIKFKSLAYKFSFHSPSLYSSPDSGPVAFLKRNGDCVRARVRV